MEAGNASAFLNKVRGLGFTSYLLTRLPAAYFSGVRIRKADAAACTVTVPYRWFTRNPFRSTYFACLSMAAEMSTGILAMAHSYQTSPAISMLVVAVNGKFVKKATGLASFTCTDGEALRQVIAACLADGEPRTFEAVSNGVNEKGELLATFSISWSFKARVRARE